MNKIRQSIINKFIEEDSVLYCNIYDNYSYDPVLRVEFKLGFQLEIILDKYLNTYNIDEYIEHIYNTVMYDAIYNHKKHLYTI